MTCDWYLKVWYAVHVVARGGLDGCSVECTSDDGELLGIVGKFTSDASWVNETIDRAAVAIWHPGGTSSGLGGSTCVHLIGVLTVAKVVLKVKTALRGEH